MSPGLSPNALSDLLGQDYGRAVALRVPLAVAVVVLAGWAIRRPDRLRAALLAAAAMALALTDARLGHPAAASHPAPTMSLDGCT